MTVMPFTKHLSNSSSNQFLIHELMAFHNVKKETYKSAGDIGWKFAGSATKLQFLLK